MVITAEGWGRLRCARLVWEKLTCPKEGTELNQDVGMRGAGWVHVGCGWEREPPPRNEGGPGLLVLRTACAPPTGRAAPQHQLNAGI